MDVYQTEEQQVDAIKGYWKENGNYIIAGLVIGFSGFIGFNVYKDNKLADEIALADAYQAVLEKSAVNSETFIAAGDKFITENSQTTYSAFTALALAKESATNKNWQAAVKYLNTAIENAPSQAIKAIATLRLARVQIQLNEIEVALTTLNTTLPASFLAAVEEIKGDAFIQQEKPQLARTAYQAAINAGGLSASPELQMKLDNLAEAVNLPK
jgi:predicted negative regulator of RcsB-dependent stress response